MAKKSNPAQNVHKYLQGALVKSNKSHPLPPAQGPNVAPPDMVEWLIKNKSLNPKG